MLGRGADFGARRGAAALPFSNLAAVFGGSVGLLSRVVDRTGVFLYRDTSKSVPTPLGVNTLLAARDFAIADDDILFTATSFRDAVEACTTFVPGSSSDLQDPTLPLDRAQTFGTGPCNRARSGRSPLGRGRYLRLPPQVAKNPCPILNRRLPPP